MMINPAHFKPAIGPEHLGMPMGPGTPRDLYIYSRRQLNIENNGMGPCIHYLMFNVGQSQCKTAGPEVDKQVVYALVKIY